MSKTAKGMILNDTEDTQEILASAIKNISEAAKKLMSGPLTRRAILILIRDKVPHIGLRDIESVLNAASELDQYLVKPAPLKKDANK